jgi:2-polyprenyl-3-methyl-5-hydroxy-6-metoxy-1,4-benzoquinol methylase
MYSHLLGFRPKLPPNITITLFECGLCGLRFYEPSIAGDDSLYKSLQLIPGYYMSAKDEFRVALEHVSPDAQVLEVGAGPGEFGMQLHSQKYVGLELSDSAVALACSKGLDVRTDSLQKHLRDVGSERYDVVCAFQVLEHVAEPRRMLENMILSVKPHGKLILSVPNDDSFVSVERNAVLNMPPHHQTRWRARCFQYLSKILPLHLICVHRETLAEYHLNSYLNTLVAELVDRTLHRNRQDIDFIHASFPMRALRALLRAPIRRALLEKRLRPLGHTMTAVLVKT